ncbi:hypothetical protein ABH940_005603 [Streptacidiphilus sp. BW17]|uniref:hypothetical protein n=1 Tax=Streptacidiphilus sp. BW17 TaxID=3156274 RepID=UPI003516736C
MTLSTGQRPGEIVARMSQPDVNLARALEQLGFTRAGTGTPHTIAVAEHEQHAVAETCARLLHQAGYIVHGTGPLVDDQAERTREAAEELDPEVPDTDPTVAVYRHPVLGVVATTATPGKGQAHGLLSNSGFHLLEHQGLYVLPFGAPLDYALNTVTRLSLALDLTHIPYDISRDINHPVPGQPLTTRVPVVQPATPGTMPNSSPFQRFLGRVDRFFERIGDNLVNLMKPRPPQPMWQPGSLPPGARSAGTVWVQVPVQQPPWQPPASITPAPGVSTKAAIDHYERSLAQAASNARSTINTGPRPDGPVATGTGAPAATPQAHKAQNPARSR